MTQPDKITHSIRFDAALHETLKQRAAESGGSVNQEVLKLLELGLEAEQKPCPLVRLRRTLARLLGRTARPLSIAIA